MNRSEAIDKLIPALVLAQAAMHNPANDAVNPHFKSRYASLPGVLDVVRPILAAHGLSIHQWPGSGDKGPVLHTLILHASGQWLEPDAFEIPASKQDAQGWGSAISYARRYSLLSICGISGDDDDDGQAAGRPARQPVRAAAPAPAVATNGNGDNGDDDGETINEAQAQRLRDLFKRKGKNLATWLKKKCPADAVPSLGLVTLSQFEEVLSYLEEQPDKGA